MSKGTKATTTPPAKQNVLDQAAAIAEALGQTKDTAPATPPAPTATAPTPTVATPTLESEPPVARFGDEPPKAGETEHSYPRKVAYEGLERKYDTRTASSNLAYLHGQRLVVYCESKIHLNPDARRDSAI